ncbi:hypothetical protein [Leifsonia aquatica]|uniref:hypothetical protein n=1 Tax=Leifsonia aquatica TaxID=144185 RepID=UPI003815E388
MRYLRALAGAGLAVALVAGGLVGGQQPAEAAVAIPSPVSKNEGWYALATANVGRFDVHLVQSPSVEKWRPVAESVLNYLNSNLGYRFTLAGGTVESAPTTGYQVPDNQIFVYVDSEGMAGALGNASAHTQLAMKGGILYSGGVIRMAKTVSQYPTSSNAAERLKAQRLFAHELGHVLGLGHFNETYRGAVQTMHTSAWSAGQAFYQEGDLNGLRALRGSTTSYGSVDSAEVSRGGDTVVTGWGLNPDALDSDVVRLSVDNGAPIEARRSVSRPDVVAALYPAIRSAYKPTADTSDNRPSQIAGFSAKLSGVAPGAHTVSLWVRDAAGDWSMVASKAFMVPFPDSSGKATAVAQGGTAGYSLTDAGEVFYGNAQLPGMPAGVRGLKIAADWWSGTDKPYVGVVGSDGNVYAAVAGGRLMRYAVPGAVDVAVGGTAVYSVTGDGRLFANASAVGGLPAGVRAVKVSASWHGDTSYVVVLGNDGRVYQGANARPLELLIAGRSVAVAEAGTVAYSLGADGGVYIAPTRMSGLPAGVSATSIAANWWSGTNKPYVAVVGSDGRVYSAQEGGVLRFNGASSITQVVVGGATTYALGTDGGVYAGGDRIPGMPAGVKATLLSASWYGGLGYVEAVGSDGAVYVSGGDGAFTLVRAGAR